LHPTTRDAGEFGVDTQRLQKMKSRGVLEAAQDRFGPWQLVEILLKDVLIPGSSDVACRWLSLGACDSPGGWRASQSLVACAGEDPAAR
jgi:hypothetical protein